MPFGDFINALPPAIFLVIHGVLFLVGAFFAWRSFSVGASGFGWGFSLYALGEISYMTYHLNATTFLFAHTLSEVLVIVGLALIFMAGIQGAAATARAR